MALTLYHPQRGSAFFMILISVFLLAAISYAVFNGSRQSATSFNREKAKIVAEEIVSYAAAAAETVQKLRLRGCADTELEFAPIPYMSNPSAPADKSCHVFDASGGKLNYKAPDSSWLMDGGYADLWVNGQTAVSGIGSPEPELLLWILDVKPEICDAINNLLNGEDAGIDNVGVHVGGFDGTYNLVSDGIGDDTGSAYTGKSSGCAKKSGQNYAYFTLIAR